MFVGHLYGDVDGPAEFLHRLDDVIGRHDNHHGVRVVPGHQGGAEARCRRRCRGRTVRRRCDLAASAGNCLAVSLQWAVAGDDPGSFRAGPGLRCGRARIAAGVRSPASVRNCFGRRLPTARPKRVPPPPAMITACNIIEISGFLL